MLTDVPYILRLKGQDYKIFYIKAQGGGQDFSPFLMWDQSIQSNHIERSNMDDDYVTIELKFHWVFFLYNKRQL